MKKVRKAIIPAAGFGTRFLPATKAIPKEMFPVVDVPTIQYIVEEAVASGITDILIITSRYKKALEDHFDRAPELEDLLRKNEKFNQLKVISSVPNMANIHYIRQQQMAGSGNAVLLGEAFVGDEPFAVLFGDDLIYNPEKPCLKQLIEAYEKTGTTILGAQTVAESELHKYGIVDAGATKGRFTQMKGLVEKPEKGKAPSRLACLGRFVLTPDIFDIIKDTKAVKGEVGLTDAICTQARGVGAYAYDFEGIRYDIGDKLGYVKATVEYSLRNEELSQGLKDYLLDITKTF